MPSPLLSTKISPPPAPARLVHRPALLERLLEWQEYRLILLSAPPGFGKTTLLCEWLSTLPKPAAWLTLDEGDNDPLRYLQYLIAALQTSNPGSAQAAMSMVQTPAPVPLTDHMLSVLGLLINEIAADPQQQLLILDDFHTINNPQVYQAMTFLLDHMPANLHLVIGTRADPAFPLALLRSRNQLLELRARHLRFTEQEADEFLQSSMRLQIRPQEANLLVERSEGWIAALQLAALAIQGRGDIPEFIQHFSGSSRYVLDYLFEEVLNRQTEAVRQFLLSTSILNRLNGSLCDAVLQQVSSQQVLIGMERANLFIQPLDPELGWFRYHRLFADLLQHQLNLVHPELVPLLNRRAAKWLEDHRLFSEAIGHWLKAGDYERASHLVHEQGLPMLEKGQIMLVLTWMKQLPETLILSDPWLSVVHAWALLLTGQVEGASARVRDAEKALPAPLAPTDQEIQPVLGQINALRAYLALITGEPQEMVPFAQSALQDLPEEALSIRSIMSFILGGAYSLAGMTDLAAQSFAQAYRQGQAAGNIHISFPAARAEAGLLIAKGQLRLAYRRCQEALEPIAVQGQPALPVSAGIYLSLGELAYEWNDLDSANATLMTGFELSQAWGNADTLLASLVDLFRVKAAQGEFETAHSWLSGAEQVARTHRLTPGTDSILAAAQFQYYLSTENWSAITDLVSLHGLQPDGEIKYLYQREWLAYAHCLIASEQWHDAETVLSRLLQIAETQGRSGDLLSSLTYLAVLDQRRGKQPEALRSMERALGLAQTQGYVRTFIDAGQSLYPLLTSISRSASVPMKSYCSQLLTSFPPGSQPALAPRSGLIEPLTTREMELLGLIAQGMSNEEIASQLFISVGTVKAHTSNIYRKLDVRGRTQAVAKARELNLLT